MNLSDLRVVVLAAACCGLLSGASAEEISGMRELAGESVTWGSLTGGGTLSNGSETLSVVTLTGAEDATFDGTITGNIRLVKTGSGVQAITRENKGYTGGTHVDGGTLAVGSLDHLGSKGSVNAPASMVYIRNGATVRVTGTSQVSPLAMSQGLCVPPGEAGVLEVENWIQKDGTLLMTNATLTLTGGGGMRLQSWRTDANSRNGRLVVTNATLVPAAGGAIGGAASGFTVDVRADGVLRMPPDAGALPNLVLAGGTVEEAAAREAGNAAGRLETMLEASLDYSFSLYRGVAVEPSDRPSVISARRIAIRHETEDPLDLAVAAGAELVLRGTVVPAASSATAFSKSGGGVLTLDGRCEMGTLAVGEGALALTAQASFGDGFLLSPADGATVRLADGVDTALRLPLRDKLLASADVWVDATQIAAAEGEAVSTLENLGAAPGSFRKESSLAPTWTANGIGGLPALAFDGSQVLFFNGYTNKADTLTTFVVMQPTAHVKWSSPFSLCSVNPTTSGGEEQVAGSFFYSFNGDTVSTIKAARGNVDGNTTDWAFQYELSTFGLDMPLLLQHCRNGSTGTGTAYCGEKHDASVQTNSSRWRQQDIERVCLGGRMLANGNPYTFRLMKGMIGELIVFTRALSSAEYAYVETYLKNKWFGAAKDIPQVSADARPRVNVEVADGATARFSPGSSAGMAGGTFVKTGAGTLLAGDFRAAAALEARAGTLALQATNVAARAAIWIDPSDAGTVTAADGAVASIANKGALGGSFTKNLGSGATLLSDGAGINGNAVLSFAKNGTLIYDGFVREDENRPRSLHVYAIVSRRSFTKFTAPFSFAHTDDAGNDKVANANFHYEEHDANGGCYRTFYGRDATGLTNGTMSAGTYFCDLPRRDADGEAYLSVNHMGANWQLTATELATDDPEAVPWYATWSCTLSPLHVNRVQLGASMRQGGKSYGEGGYWDGRIGEFIVFDEALPAADEAELLAYLRAKWLGKGDVSATPPACLTGKTLTTSLYDQMTLAVEHGATLRHAVAPLPIGMLALRDATVARAPATADAAGFTLFSVAGDLSLSGSLTLTASAFPAEDVPLVTYGGELADTSAWTLTGGGAALFTPVADTARKVYWLKRQNGTLMIFR